MAEIRQLYNKGRITTVNRLKTIVTWLAVIAAFVAAGFWIASASVPVSARDFAGFGAPLAKAVYVMSLQIAWNRDAAIATGISALLQAIALALPKSNEEPAVQLIRLKGALVDLINARE